MMAKVFYAHELVAVGLWLLVSPACLHAQVARARENRSNERLATQSVLSNAHKQDQLHAPIYGSDKCHAANSDLCDGRTNYSASRLLVSNGWQPTKTDVSAASKLDAQVKPNSSTTAAPHRANLIARTSDAIYRALMGYFSQDDELERLDSKTTASSSEKASGIEHAEKAMKPVPKETTRTPRSNNAPGDATTTAASSSPKQKNKTREMVTSKVTILSSSSSPLAPETTPESEIHSNRTTIPSPSPSRPKPTAPVVATKPFPATSIKPTSNSVLSTTTSATTASRGPRADARPTVQPHLDLTSFRDEPHSAATRTGSTAPANWSQQTKAHTATSTVPTTRRAIATTTRAPTSGPSPLIGSPQSIEDQARGTTPWSSFKPTDHATAGDGRLVEAHENSLEYFSLLNRAFNSIQAANELAYLNRTTRLAHESENSHDGAATVSLAAASSQAERSFNGEREGDPPDESTPSLSDAHADEAKQQAQKLQQQATTRDDIMLLCKLLHKQLENGSIISANGTLLAANGTNLASPAASNSQRQQRTSSSSTTARPRDLLHEFLSSGLHVSDQQNDLNDTHDDHLLESAFSLEKRAANELSYEEAAQRLLQELFNAGFRRKFAHQLNISNGAEEAGVEDSNSLASSGQRIAPVRLKSWSRTITGGKGGRLKLIYWLVMPASDSLAPKFKVLRSDEAEELLDELEHTAIQRAVDEVPLVRPLVLLAPFKRAIRTNESPSPTANEQLMPSAAAPNVLDDDLTSDAPKSKAAPKTPAMRGFIERLFTGPFEENLQIYLIALIVLLFLVVMCFAMPMICCRSCSLFGRRSESSAALMASASGPRFVGQAAPGKNKATSLQQQQQQQQQPDRQAKHNGRRPRARNGAHTGSKHQTSGDGAIVSSENGQKALSNTSRGLDLRAHLERKRSEEEPPKDYDEFDLCRTSGTINEAVWTKLSNSTSTLTKDRTRLMHDDGQLHIPIMRQRQSDDEHHLLTHSGADEERMKRFEWYTFEDKTTTTRRQLNGHDDGRRDKQSQTLTDHMKMSKSVQTNEEPAGGERPFNLSFSDRLETRHSDTLTKSELVMLKEKLIPIGRQKVARTPPPPPPPPAEPRNEQVRPLAPRTSHDYVNQPARHIDSSVDESSNGASKSLVDPVKLTAAPASQTTSCGRAALEDERTATMRYLELPGKTRSKVEAIRSELSKLEARDSASSGAQAPSTYKRFDVI